MDVVCTVRDLEYLTEGAIAMRKMLRQVGNADAHEALVADEMAVVSRRTHGVGQARKTDSKSFSKKD